MTDDGTDDGAALSPLDWESVSNYPMYYDKVGRPIDLMRWAVLFEDVNYKMVLGTDIFSADDPLHEVVRVSTVWLGLDHNFIRWPGRKYRPHIFESMVFQGHQYLEIFDRDFPIDRDQERYSTLREAWYGHFGLVEEWKQHVPNAVTKMDWEPHPYIVKQHLPKVSQEGVTWLGLQSTGLPRSTAGS